MRRAYQGPDAYLRDENGNPVPETVRKVDKKAQLSVLKRHRRNTWGKHPKIDAPREGGVLVIGDVTKKPKYNTARSVEARKWKADSRRIREGKGLVSSRIFEQRRMKAEKKMGIPISLRSGFAISTENGKAAYAMHAASADDNSGKLKIWGLRQRRAVSCTQPGATARVAGTARKPETGWRTVQLEPARQ
jgi:hypothetical protein